MADLVPRRICGYYDPETSESCGSWGTFIVAHDEGAPGAAGVPSGFRCVDHVHRDRTVRAYADYAQWYASNILELKPQEYEWDLL